MQMYDSFETGRAWIELDFDALRHNVAALRARLPSGCALMPAVKANAYGHGAALICRELKHLGIQAFCVASAQEGAALRQSGVRGEILILGYTAPQQLELLRQYDLTQSIVDASYAQLLSRSDRPIRAHIAVDTGMHRTGVPWQDTQQILAMLAMPHLRVTGVYTHLCADDMPNPAARAFTQTQAARFARLSDELHRRGYALKHHILSSYGLLHYPQFGGDYARVGIALYGVLSSRGDLARCPIALRPVLSLKARIALTRRIGAGEAVGYGLAYKAKQSMTVAVVTIGYADGVPRSLGCGRGSVLIRGQRAPIVGRVCMDQLMVDVSEIPDTAAGDAAVLIGSSGTQSITAYDWAEISGTITNEVLSRLGDRPDRIPASAIHGEAQGVSNHSREKPQSV